MALVTYLVSGDHLLERNGATGAMAVRAIACERR
jgi:hypothetical protein